MYGSLRKALQSARGALICYLDRHAPNSELSRNSTSPHRRTRLAKFILPDELSRANNVHPSESNGKRRSAWDANSRYVFAASRGRNGSLPLVQGCRATKVSHTSQHLPRQREHSKCRETHYETVRRLSPKTREEAVCSTPDLLTLAKGRSILWLCLVTPE